MVADHPLLSSAGTDNVGRILRTFKIKKKCGGNRQWQNHYLRNWAANTKGKGII
ncbi:hypothetical protein CLONEX_03995 [[Clostridium] nexile DSM 1787]|nr:hypothetical protein CLONEX_03995 [[Clostridium] nexile DSM 1787]